MDSEVQTVTDRPRAQPDLYAQGRKGRSLPPPRRNRMYVPPETHVAAQFVFIGSQEPVMVRADTTVSMDITVQMGPLVTIYHDKEAALSALERAYMEIAVIERLYPDLDAELDKQRQQRRFGLEVDRGDTSYLNGTGRRRRPQPLILNERQRRQARARKLPNETIAEIGRKCGFELADDEIADVRKRAATVHPAEQRQIETNDYDFGIIVSMKWRSSC